MPWPFNLPIAQQQDDQPSPVKDTFPHAGENQISERTTLPGRVGKHGLINMEMNLTDSPPASKSAHSLVLSDSSVVKCFPRRVSSNRAWMENLEKAANG